MSPTSRVPRPASRPPRPPGGLKGGALTRDSGRRTQDAGFTLVEVLVALVIVSAALVVLAQGFTVGGEASGRAQRATLAAMLAESKIADLETGQLSATSSATGTFEPDYPDYSWEILPEAASSGLTQVTVIVSWKERGQDRTFELVRLMSARRSSQ